MPVGPTSRDPIFRTWNIAIISIAIVLVAIFSVQLSAHSTASEATLSSATAGVITTDGRRLNARGGPGTNFAIVGKIEPDTVVEILDSNGDGQWLNVQVDGIADAVWVAAEYVAVGDAPRAQEPAPRTAAQATATPRVAANLAANLAASPAANLAPNTSTSATPVTRSQTTTEASAVTAPIPAAVVASTEADSGAGTGADTEDAGVETDSVTGSSAEPDLLLSLLPTVTPTPVRAEEAGATPGDSPAARLAVRVAPLNLQPLTGRSSTVTATGTDSDSDGNASPAAADSSALVILSPTATPLPAPAATATPAPTPNVPTAFTQPARMNVRAGPGTNFAVLTSVAAGTGLEIRGINPAGDWYQISVSGQEEPGWIFAPLTQPAGPLDVIVRLSEEDLPQPPPPPPALEPVAATQAAPAAATQTVAVSAPAPSGGGPFGYGLQAHMLGGGTDRSLAAVSDLGFNWIKQQVQWKLFEPSPGGRNFGELHQIVDVAGSRGINVLFSVVDAPEWAREPGFDGSVGGPPQDPATFAAFLGAMAGTFCGSSLKAIEVWNEQNLHYEWGNRPLNPAEYMNLLRPSYAAIKAACPSMYVISGALTPAGTNMPFAMDDFQYLEAMYQNGLANYADGIGAHPSGYNVPPSVTWQNACAAIQTHGNSFNGACDSPHHSWSFRSTMEGYRNIMVTYGDANKKVWPTEFGWAAGGAFDPRYAYANDNTFDEQAAWTVEAYQMMRAWGWVGPAILWNLNFRVVADGTEKAQWGIVSNNWEPLPIYHALKGMPK